MTKKTISKAEKAKKPAVKKAEKTRRNSNTKKTKLLKPLQMELIKNLTEIPSRYSSHKELYDSLKIPESTFYEWMKNEAFLAELRHAMDIIYKGYGAKVRSALVKASIQGDVHAIKLYLKHAEGWSEKIGLEHSGSVEQITGIRIVKPEGEK